MPVDLHHPSRYSEAHVRLLSTAGGRVGHHGLAERDPPVTRGNLAGGDERRARESAATRPSARPRVLEAAAGENHRHAAPRSRTQAHQGRGRWASVLWKLGRKPGGPDAARSSERQRPHHRPEIQLPRAASVESRTDTVRVPEVGSQVPGIATSPSYRDLPRPRPSAPIASKSGPCPVRLGALSAQGDHLPHEQRPVPPGSPGSRVAERRRPFVRVEQQRQTDAPGLAGWRAHRRPGPPAETWRSAGSLVEAKRISPPHEFRQCRSPVPSNATPITGPSSPCSAMALATCAWWCCTAIDRLGPCPVRSGWRRSPGAGRGR